MKPAVGIVIAAIALTSVDAGKSLVGVKSPESSSDDASATGESSWDFSWDASDSTDASGSSCNEICPTKYDPVCGSDGVTYVNDCALSIAQCNATELTLTATGECAGGSVSSSVKGSKSGSSDTGCPDACLDVYDPVSDESGKTYSNDCYMRLAKCKNTKKDVDVLAEYKKLYGRSFGASRDDSVGGDSSSDDSGSSSTAVKGASKTTTADKSTKSTKSTKASKSTKKSSTTTSGVGSLYEDGSSGVIGSDRSSDRSECAGTCPDIYSPVCGSNGVTYSSSCQLELASCQKPELKLVQATEDVCSDTTTTKQETVSKKTSTSTKTA